MISVLYWKKGAKGRKKSQSSASYEEEGNLRKGRPDKEKKAGGRTIGK